MAKNPCKCKKSPECEECPEWIFTFADLVMLMMGFFVILWVLKPNPGKSDAATTPQDEEWIKTVAAIREAFGYMPDPHSKDPIDEAMTRKLHVPTADGPRQGGQAHIQRHSPEGLDVEMQTLREGKHAILGGRFLFEEGRSTVTPETAKALDEIAEQIRGHYNIVLVKGHASGDDLPEGAAPQQLMDLSVRRAQAAVDYLTAKGIDAEILRVQGCSTFEPLVQHAYTPEARAVNRRVEIEVTPVLVGQRQGSPKPSTTPTTGPSNVDK